MLLDSATATRRLIAQLTVGQTLTKMTAFCPFAYWQTFARPFVPAGLTSIRRLMVRQFKFLPPSVLSVKSYFTVGSWPMNNDACEAHYAVSMSMEVI